MNLKTLCYISAWLQITVCAIIIIYFAIALATHDLEMNENGLETELLIFLIITIVSIPFLVCLLVGIRKNRMILVGIFHYAAHTLLVVCVIYVVYKFIMGFVHKADVGGIIIHMMLEGVVIGLEFILTVPIHVFYKRRNIPTNDESQCTIKEKSKSLRSVTSTPDGKSPNKEKSKSVRSVSYAP